MVKKIKSMKDNRESTCSSYFDMKGKKRKKWHINEFRYELILHTW